MASSASLRSAVVLTVWTALVWFLFGFDFVPVKARCYDLKCGHSIFYVGSSLLKSHQMSQGSVALVGVVDPEGSLML